MITKFDFNAAIELTSLFQLFCISFSMQVVNEATFSNSSFYVPNFRAIIYVLLPLCCCFGDIVYDYLK